MSESKKFKVFVYGFLKKGYWNSRLLTGQKFIGEAITKPVYNLYNLGAYPGLKISKNGKPYAVKGEVWEVTEQCLSRLDSLEGHPNFYKRQNAELENFDGDVETYIYQGKVREENNIGSEWNG